MVAIPNQHFFRWVAQLEESGFDVFWFDITDSGQKTEQISWVNQIKKWKLKWDFPLRTTLKQKVPSVYKLTQYINETNSNTAFFKTVNKIQPDIIQCFEMKLAGLPILETLNKFKNIPLVYSSWGSDLFYFKELGTPKEKVNAFLSRVNYLITDCKRDQYIARENGFKNTLLGVFPGNGGIDLGINSIVLPKERKCIIIKGYQFDVGEAIQVLKAIEVLPEQIKKNYTFIIYSADKEIKAFISNSKYLNNVKFKILERHIKVPNQELITLMSKSIIHIGNNLSDGMPNTMLEAMSQGCFPIQSNPGNATAEIIKDGFNGYLINNPYDFESISKFIISTLNNEDLINNAMQYNIQFIKDHYNRNVLKSEIVNLYKSIILN
jgi:hypothetical protein